MPPPTILDTAASSRPQYPIPRPKSRRPASLAELAERARNNGWDPNLGIKHWLKTAERHRNNGSNLVKSGDLEAGFVELATAATLVMEKVPSHRDYHTMLNHNLRKNLGTVSDCCIDLVYFSVSSRIRACPLSTMTYLLHKVSLLIGMTTLLIHLFVNRTAKRSSIALAN